MLEETALTVRDLASQTTTAYPGLGALLEVSTQKFVFITTGEHKGNSVYLWQARLCPVQNIAKQVPCKLFLVRKSDIGKYISFRMEVSMLYSLIGWNMRKESSAIEPPTFLR